MRSTRLASTLLLTLLFGWTVRAYRKGGTTPLPASPPTISAPPNEVPKAIFPDE